MSAELEALGWGPDFAEGLAAAGDRSLVPGRVAVERRKSLEVWTAIGPVSATVSGRLRHTAAGRGDLPVVGDWVGVLANGPGGGMAIHAVLPRRTAFRRKAAGNRVEEQVVASNVDTVFLVTGLDEDFNLRRIERYLTVAWDSGARPVVVLNKADLCAELDARVADVERVAPGVDVVPVSAKRDGGVDPLAAYLERGRTVALLGSSGVGKSTISNRLIGDDVLKTNAVREHDGRGKHTTTHRAMFVLPSGALLIDTPGMRELQVWTSGSGLDAAFDDIAVLAAECRFSDCSHQREPGCAVALALEEGRLDQARFESYVALGREMRHIAVKQDEHLKLVEKQKLKAIHKAMRHDHKRDG